MASATTPRRSAQRRPGRPTSNKRHISASGSGRPEKKLRYIPGGPGGGGRYIDDNGNETAVGGTGPGGPGFSGTRRSSHRPTTGSPPTMREPRPRRTPAPPQEPRYSSAAAAAASAISQSEGYKPREERSWEEFHPDLDIDVELMVYTAEEVDGMSRDNSNPVTPLRGLARSMTENGGATMLKDALQAQQNPTMNGLSESDNPFSNAPMITPYKRRPGRPPKHAMLTGLGSPPAPRIIPLPTHNPKERLNLPKPNYKRIETFKKFEEAKNVGLNFVDKSMASLGYQETDRFDRHIETYIRNTSTSFEDESDIIEVLRSDDNSAAVVGKVEYDMDEQDEAWLESINSERLAEQVEGIKPAMFEITITQIEKEWHALEKRIPKPSPKAPQTHRPRSGSAAAVNGEPGPGEEQDTKCAICDDGDCENTNAIVFCDGCDLAVHQECYGVPFIPEGQWHCRKCQLLGKNNVTCIFCPNTDGAFKQTNALKWAHLLCAIWIPEVTLGNQTFMEPIMDVEKVPKQRWKLSCYICQQKMGACIQCANKNCYTAFHVTCARRGQLYLRMKNNGTPIDMGALKGYCHKHVPSEWRKERRTDLAIVDAVDYYKRMMKGRKWADSQTAALSLSAPNPTGYLEEEELEENAAAAATNKRKRLALQKKIWRLPSGAPIVPHAVYEMVEQALQRFPIRKRKEFVAEACKYWSLKREARRGASLLKRLQLQMEIFSTMELTRRNFKGMGAAGLPRLLSRIEFAEGLETELARIQNLSAMIKSREDIKLGDVDELRTIIDAVYTPINPLLFSAVEKAISLDDINHYYFTAGLEELRAKVLDRFYTSVIPFTTDLAQVFREKIGFVREGKDGKVKLEPEQKHVKQRATIIVTKIKPMLMDAARKEAELGVKGDEAAEEDAQRVLVILQTALKGGPSSVHPSITDAEDEGSAHAGAVNGLPNGHTDVDADGDVEMAEATGRESDAPNNIGGLTAHEEVLQSNGIKVQSENGDEAPGVTIEDIDGSIPALSNSGSTNPSHGQVDPTTPPRSDKDLLAPLAKGGHAWYLEPFAPHGTTIHDEEWSGRDVLRDMSEELSELDEDALNGLVDKDELQDDDVPATSAGELLKPSAAAAKKKKAASRRRR